MLKITKSLYKSAAKINDANNKVMGFNGGNKHLLKSQEYQKTKKCLNLKN